MRFQARKIQYSSLSPLHGDSWIERQRKAGEVLSSIMGQLTSLVKDKSNMSLLEMDRFAENEIIKHNCQPTFKGYKGYPNALITSVNKQLVHGIPSDYKLEDGDVISFDFGVSFEGAICDSALTLIYGEPKNKDHVRMLAAGQECLYNAIKTIRPGMRIGSIGNAIYRTARHAGFQVISEFGGHALDWNTPHSAPFVPNRSNPDEGIRIRPGMSLAIEPLLVPNNCSTKTHKSNDGWTIYTDDISCHFEHSIFIHEDKVEIMTHRSGEKISREVSYCQNIS